MLFYRYLCPIFEISEEYDKQTDEPEMVVGYGLGGGSAVGLVPDGLRCRESGR